MGRLRTHEERQAKKMKRNPPRTVIPEPDNQDKPVELTEGQKLVQFLLGKSQNMAKDYKNTIKHTGSLVSASMAFAYQKAIIDITSLLIKEVYKETKDEKTVTEAQQIPGVASQSEGAAER